MMSTINNAEGKKKIIRDLLPSKILGSFEKLQKAAVSFFVSVYPSFRLSIWSLRIEHLGSQFTDFYKIVYFRMFRKTIKKIQSLKSYKNEGHIT